MEDICSIFALSTDNLPAYSINAGFKPQLFNFEEAQAHLRDLLDKIAPIAEDIVNSWGIPEK